MAGEQILAIDNGTQSVRALIFDLKGNLIAKKRVPIEPYYSTKPGWAEQDPEVFWKGVCDACQGLWQMEGVNKNAIAGVGLTTQRSHCDQSGCQQSAPAPGHRLAGSTPGGRYAAGRGTLGVAFQYRRDAAHRAVSAV